MSIEGALMLKMLGSGVRAIGSAVSNAFKPVESASFEDLLSRASHGRLNGSSPVAVDPAAGVTLDQSQLARLAVATDQAATQGAESALIIIDGAALTVDVEQRRVIGRVDLDEPGALEGHDAVIRAGRQDGASVTETPVDRLEGIAPSFIDNPSVNQILGR